MALSDRLLEAWEKKVWESGLYARSVHDRERRLDRGSGGICDRDAPRRLRTLDSRTRAFGMPGQHGRLRLSEHRPRCDQVPYSGVNEAI